MKYKIEDYDYIGLTITFYGYTLYFDNHKDYVMARRRLENNTETKSQWFCDSSRNMIIIRMMGQQTKKKLEKFKEKMLKIIEGI